MSKKLVVAEKPSVGRDIAKVLNCTNKQDGYIEGDEYIVTWAVGHLIGLKTPDDHDPEYAKWNLEDLPLVFPIEKSLKVLPATKKQFKIIKSLIQRPDVDEIINAGDAGREGYLIQKWIYRMAGNKKPEKVLWASSFTEEAVKKHMKNLKDDSLFIGILNEAEARSEGDNILGINYSRVLTLTKGGGNNTLSYGRCQTPLEYQIVLRDLEIENFVPKPYYNVEAVFDKGYKGFLISKDKERISFDNRTDAEKIANHVNGKNGFVQSYKKESKKSNPPLLYNLSKLQQAMGRKYGYTPDETLKIAQSLYETHKILSYPRTDSQYLSNDLYNEITEHLDCCRFDNFEGLINKIDFSSIKADKRYFNDHKVTDHHALIPTINKGMKNIYSKLSEKEKNVFDAVVLSLIAIFYPDYEYYSTEIITNVEDNLFLSKGTVPKFLGYKEVLKNTEEEKKDDDKEENAELPVLNENDSVVCINSAVLDKMTKPPARYNNSTIIQLMEKHNIGTPATRAEIINKLIHRNFLKLEKGKYISTELGRNFVKVVPDNLKDIQLTKHFEEQLALVNDGTITKQQFLDDIVTELKANITQFVSDMKLNPTPIVSGNSSESIGKCPCCGSDITENSKAFGCSNYKNGCEFAIWKNISGKTITKTIAKQLISNQVTNEIKGFKSKAGKSYNALLKLEPNGKTKNGQFPAYKVSLEFANSHSNQSNNAAHQPTTSSLVCPDCGKHLTNDKWAYKCECGFSVSKNICQRDLKEAEIDYLLKNKKSEKLDGFISKKGKSFSAYLVLDNGKVNFSFD